MKIGPKYKIARRLGSGIFDKTQTQKFTLSEARKGRQRKGRPRTLSDFGRQLIEKQRARYTYGISERRLSRYVKEIDPKASAAPVTQLMRRLELRLDNVVYRAGLAASRQQARQMVSHGHITVNGRKLNIPSHELSPEDAFAVREGSRERTLFTDLAERLEGYATPAWLSFDPKALAGTVRAAPEAEALEPAFDPSLVLEFYSR